MVMDKDLLEHLEVNFFVSEKVMELFNGGNSKVQEIFNSRGRFSLCGIASEITVLFVLKYEGKEWDGEYLETIESFTIDYLKDYEICG